MFSYDYDIDELHEDMIFKEDVDIYGNPVKRTRKEFPWSYDPVVIFKLACFEEKDTAFYSDQVDGEFSEKEQDKAMEITGKKMFGGEFEHFSWKNPHDVEGYLSILMRRNLKVTAITEGANLETGNPYWIVYVQNAD